MGDTTVRFIAADDRLAKPLFADLEREYDTRYGDFFGEAASTELSRYPLAEFAPPHGAFLVLTEPGAGGEEAVSGDEEAVAGGEEAVSGGAFRRYDERTAELKRIWTRPDRRGRGLARRVVAELEAEARRRGYEQIFLTTGPRQPEAVALYLASGYEPQFDPSLPASEIGVHAFRKSLAREEAVA